MELHRGSCSVCVGTAYCPRWQVIDLKVLFEIFDFDKEVLQSAVRRTFERRRTPMPSGLPTALTDEFASNAKKMAQWKGFCRKSRIEAIPLSEVLVRLADKVDEYKLFSAQLHV